MRRLAEWGTREDKVGHFTAVSCADGRAGTHTRKRAILLRAGDLALLLGFALLISSCASRPDAIAPSNISALEYNTLSCEETTALLAQKREQEIANAKSQNTAATWDTIGVTLLLLPLGTIFGGDSEGKVAQSKGEVLALERAVRINCKRDVALSPVETSAASPVETSAALPKVAPPPSAQRQTTASTSRRTRASSSHRTAGKISGKRIGDCWPMPIPESITTKKRSTKTDISSTGGG